jgi:hypothetical protein
MSFGNASAKQQQQQHVEDVWMKMCAAWPVAGANTTQMVRRYLLGALINY